MAKWGRVEDQATNTFKRALARKGYLSLCSIIESQYFIPRSYSMDLIKNEYLIIVSRPQSKGLLPQQINISTYQARASEKEKTFIVSMYCSSPTGHF